MNITNSESGKLKVLFKCRKDISTLLFHFLSYLSAFSYPGVFIFPLVTKIDDENDVYGFAFSYNGKIIDRISQFISILDEIRYFLIDYKYKRYNCDNDHINYIERLTNINHIDNIDHMLMSLDFITTSIRNAAIQYNLESYYFGDAILDSLYYELRIFNFEKIYKDFVDNMPDEFRSKRDISKVFNPKELNALHDSLYESYKPIITKRNKKTAELIGLMQYAKSYNEYCNKLDETFNDFDFKTAKIQPEKTKTKKEETKKELKNLKYDEKIDMLSSDGSIREIIVAICDKFGTNSCDCLIEFYLNDIVRPLFNRLIKPLDEFKGDIERIHSSYALHCDFNKSKVTKESYEEKFGGIPICLVTAAIDDIYKKQNKVFDIDAAVFLSTFRDKNLETLNIKACNEIELKSAKNVKDKLQININDLDKSKIVELFHDTRFIKDQELKFDVYLSIFKKIF